MLTTRRDADLGCGKKEGIEIQVADRGAYLKHLQKILQAGNRILWRIGLGSYYRTWEHNTLFLRCKAKSMELHPKDGARPSASGLRPAVSHL